MQQWLKVKESRKKPTIKDILQLAVKKKREDALRKAQGKSKKEEEIEKRRKAKLQKKAELAELKK